MCPLQGQRLLVRVAWELHHKGMQDDVEINLSPHVLVFV